MRDYRAEVALLAEKYLGRPLKEIELSAMIRDLVHGAMKYGIEIPPDFMLVGKALMTIEGIGKELDPDLDVFGEAQPVLPRAPPQALLAASASATSSCAASSSSRGAAYDVPLQTREILDDLRLGRLTLQTTNPPSRAGRPARPPPLRGPRRRLVRALRRRGSSPRASRSGLGITLLVIGVLVVLGHLAGDLARPLPAPLSRRSKRGAPARPKPGSALRGLASLLS